MSEKVEYVELTVKVPKAIMNFFEAFLNFMGDYTGPRQFLREVLHEMVKSFTEEFIAETCNSDFYNGKLEVVDKYGLRPVIDVRAVGIDC